MTRTVMGASVVVLAAQGATALFAPEELLAYAGSPPDVAILTAIQLAGAAWLGFALLNWAARGTMLGGIYGRPTALANLAHFTIGTLVLAKTLSRVPPTAAAVVFTAAYCALAVLFGWIVFIRDPLPR